MRPGDPVHGPRPASAAPTGCFKDALAHPTWYLTFNGVLAKSSNIGTILATAARPATSKLYDDLREFGFGAKPGTGLPRRGGRAPARPGRTGRAASRARSPFGQGVSVNALQAACVYSTIANGGVRVDPALVRGTTGAERRVRPGPARQADPGGQRADRARSSPRMLESAVSEEGTGTKAAHPRLPGRGQDRHRQARTTPDARATAATPRRSSGSPPPTSPGTVVLRPPEPPGGPLRRRDRRPGLQEGHGVRAEEPEDPADRNPAAPRCGYAPESDE